MNDYKFSKARLQFDNDGTWLCLNVGDKAKTFVDNMGDKTYVAEVKEYRKKRSLDANAYFWVLADKLANVLDRSKEEIYREYVREVGKFDIIAIKSEAVESLKKHWEKGLGAMVIVDGDAKGMKGYKRVFCYYGSSDYNSKEMSRLIDWIVDECKEQGIETMTPQELEILKENWK